MAAITHDVNHRHGPRNSRNNVSPAERHPTPFAFFLTREAVFAEVAMMRPLLRAVDDTLHADAALFRGAAKAIGPNRDRPYRVTRSGRAVGMMFCS